MQNQRHTKGSHFLPKTYLKHFLENEKLCMYLKGERFFKDRLSEGDRIKDVVGINGLAAIAKQNHLYLADVPNLNPNVIEDLLREISEDEFDDLLRQINELKTGELIPAPVKEKICLQMASFRVRTPFFKWEMETIQTNILKHTTKLRYAETTPDELSAIYKKRTGKIMSLKEANKILGSIKGDNYEITWDNLLFIKSALEMIEPYSRIMQDMNMRIFRPKGNRLFITSDNPLVYFVPPEKSHLVESPRNIASEHSQVFFSLTKNISIHLSRTKRKEEVLEIDRELSDIHNYNIATNAFEFIFSPIRMNFLSDYVKIFHPYPFKFSIS